MLGPTSETTTPTEPPEPQARPARRRMLGLTRRAPADHPLRHVGEEPDPRFTFANERTFLAWNRTALALIAAGIALAEVVDFHHDWLRLVLGVPLLCLGAIIALLSYRQWELNERALRLDEPLPHSPLSRTLAAATGVIALAAAIAVLIDVGGR